VPVTDVYLARSRYAPGSGISYSAYGSVMLYPYRVEWSGIMHSIATFKA
jgi:hypothetical protein